VNGAGVLVGLVPGLAAGSLATAGMLAASQLTGEPSIAEILAERIVPATPIELIIQMTATFGSAAKKMLFGSVLAGQVVFAAALGMILWSAGPKRTLAIVGGAAAFLALVILPSTGAGVAGAATRAGAPSTLVSLALTAGLYVFTYTALSGWMRSVRTAVPAIEARERRAVLRVGLLTVGAAAAGAGAYRWITERPSDAIGAFPALAAPLEGSAAQLTAPASQVQDVLAAGLPGLSPEITSNDAFYQVSKNVVRDPDLNAARWRLEVAGAVDRPMSFTYEQLKALPSANQYVTLQCVGNPVGGDLIGCADWRGVPIRSLLQQAGVRPGAVDVVFHGADDYTSSIPIAKAIAAGTILAYEMNGEVLPQGHGYPARLLIPDTLGFKNVKWVTKIEVVDYNFLGYWEERGWTNDATWKTTSRIDVPRAQGALLPGKNYIGGIAAAGDRGISRVEISTDSGQTWSPATVKPPLGPYSWVLWLYEWDAPAAAAAQIMVRATDGLGGQQIEVTQPEFPDIATGLHKIDVRLAVS
jgi:DMSO/TMAO reductase YedYZ molybdopterin-dependent catalytic subunit